MNQTHNTVENIIYRYYTYNKLLIRGSKHEIYLDGRQSLQLNERDEPAALVDGARPPHEAAGRGGRGHHRRRGRVPVQPQRRDGEGAAPPAELRGDGLQVGPRGRGGGHAHETQLGRGRGLVQGQGLLWVKTKRTGRTNTCGKTKKRTKRLMD